MIKFAIITDAMGKNDITEHQTITEGQFIYGIRELLETARNNVVKQVNTTMLMTYFEIGRRIVEQEQKGENQAGYGQYLLVHLSESLSGRFGKGFSKRNLELMRQFYLTYKIAKSSISQSLSWTHYIRLMRISDPKERAFYEIEAANNNWSVKELNRQFDSALYQRLALSRDKDKILELSKKGQLVEKPEDILKDPYILEFTGLKELPEYSESRLEQSLIDELQSFLLELGKGFTFVGRQQRGRRLKVYRSFVHLESTSLVERCRALMELDNVTIKEFSEFIVRSFEPPHGQEVLSLLKNSRFF